MPKIILGVCENTSFSKELHIKTNNPQTAADSLHKKYGILFHKIIVQLNGKNGPEIVAEWQLDKDYKLTI